MEVFGSSGVRGVVGEELTPERVTRVAMAAAAEFDTADDGSTGGRTTASPVALSRDTRRSGSLFLDAAAAGLAAAGRDVHRLDPLPTPGLQAYCGAEGIPGVMITASHNPPEYNGLKLIGADGIELGRERLERIATRLENDQFDRADWRRVGQRRAIDGTRERYRGAITAAVDRERIADADLTVAVDPGHGAASHTTPTLFRELGCTVETVNADPDGAFPGRDPEPVAANLGALRDLVRAGDADLGVAHDGDGDRAVFVDERGRHVDGDAALAALTAASVEPGEIVVSAVNASQRLVEAVTAADARLELTAIGSTNLITRARDLAAAGERVAIAGEANGGVMFPGYRLARDGAYTAARFLELVVDRAVSDLVAPYDGYHLLRTVVKYDTAAERDRLTRAARRFATESDVPVDTTDGYRLEFDDGWVLVRPSGTEPLFRVSAEATSRDRAERLLERAVDALERA